MTPLSSRTRAEARTRTSSARDWRRSLPQPFHLFALLTRSRHYHFGVFDPSGPAVRSQSSLSTALRTTVELCERRLLPGSFVLDVGSGLGGTSELLARAGHRCVGIDPDGAVVRASRRFSRGTNRLHFARARFEDLARRSNFDGVLLLEVLPHLPAPAELLRRSRRLLRDGGRMVVADLFLASHVRLRDVPFHRFEDFVRHAEAVGLELRESEERTEAVSPMLPLLLERIGRHRSRLERYFRDSHPSVLHQIEELESQCRLLRKGLGEGVLQYRIASFQRLACAACAAT